MTDYSSRSVKELMFRHADVMLSHFPGVGDALLELMSSLGEFNPHLDQRANLAWFIYSRLSEVHPNHVRAVMRPGTDSEGSSKRIDIELLRKRLNPLSNAPYWWEEAYLERDEQPSCPPGPNLFDVLERFKESD